MAVKHAVTITKVDRHDKETAMKVLVGYNVVELKKRAVDLAEKMNYGGSIAWDRYIVSDPIECE